MSQNHYVAITRDQASNRLWSSQLIDRGLDVYELACIETAVAPLSAKIERALKQLASYDWLIFTSQSGVTYFKELLDTLDIRVDSLKSIPVAVVGRQTAIAAQRLGIRVSFIPTRAESMTLSRELPEVAHRKVLFLRTNIAPNEPVQTLRSRLAEVTELVIYNTELVKSPDPHFGRLLEEKRIRTIVFASPSALFGFKLRINQPKIFKLAQAIPVIAIGPHIANELADAGFLHIKTAVEPSIEGVIDQLP